MPILTPKAPRWREYVWPHFTGGYSTSPRSDAECLVFENFETTRDGYVNSRMGLLPAHTAGQLGSGRITEMVYDPSSPDNGPCFLIAKEGGLIYSVSSAPTGVTGQASCTLPAGYSISGLQAVQFDFVATT